MISGHGVWQLAEAIYPLGDINRTPLSVLNLQQLHPTPASGVDVENAECCRLGTEV
jgi:hypothetical protein